VRDPIGLPSSTALTVSHALVSPPDLYVTVADYIGATVPHRDGMSLKPLVRGNWSTWPRTIQFGEYINIVSDVVPSYRLARGTPGNVAGKWKYIDYLGADTNELYDLVNDPSELTNKAGASGTNAQGIKYSDAQAGMQRALADYSGV
jgi:arylsulfatase A-like enzyme